MQEFLQNHPTEPLQSMFLGRIPSLVERKYTVLQNKSLIKGIPDLLHYRKEVANSQNLMIMTGMIEKKEGLNLINIFLKTIGQSQKLCPHPKNNISHPKEINILIRSTKDEGDHPVDWLCIKESLIRLDSGILYKLKNVIKKMSYNFLNMVCIHLLNSGLCQTDS